MLAVAFYCGSRAVATDKEFDHLMARVAARDQEATRLFCRRYQGLVTSVTRRWLVNHPQFLPLVDSDDLSQLTWCAFFKALLKGQLRVTGNNHMRRLLCRFAQRVSQTEQRRYRRHRRNIVLTTTLEGTGSVAISRRGTLEVLEQRDFSEVLLSRLDPYERRIVSDRYDGRTYERIAADMELSTEAVRSRFRRAIGKLSGYVDTLSERAVSSSRARSTEGQGSF